jgi:hypothetical protein
MKLKILVGILVFLILVNLGTIGTYLYMTGRGMHRPIPELAGPPLGGPRPGGMPPEGVPTGEPPPGGRPPLAMMLDASQQEQLNRLMETFVKDTWSSDTAARDLEESTFKMLQKDHVPQEEVEANLEKISALHLQISKRAFQSLMEAKSFLRPDQQQRLFDIIIGGRPG